MMKNVSAQLVTLLTLGALLASLIACTQKREDQWAQGQGEEHIEALPEFNGKSYPLTTGRSLGKSNNTQSDSFKVDEETTEFNNMDLVTYKTQAQLMPTDIDFRGRANWRYEILYKVGKNYLKIMKVGPKKDIPFQERTYAEKLKDGRLAVPLIGYPINHIKKVKALDRNNNETHEWITINLQGPEGDSFFRINKTDYVRFEALNKNELFPVSFFGLNENDDSDPSNDRHWYYAETIMAASKAKLNDYSGLGVLGDDSDNTLASKVKFIRTAENELKVVNSATIQEVNALNKLHNAGVLSIPAKYADFRVKQQGSENSLTEVLDTRKHFKKRKYVQVNFSNTASINNHDRNHQLVEVKVGTHKDGRRYMSYTLMLHKAGSERVRVKYSFLEAPKISSYKIKYAFQDDIKTFGALNRRLKRRHNFRLRTKRDYDLTKVITRHGLSKRDRNITFNISESTKRRYLPLARRTVKIWNDGLTRAKINLRITLDETPATLGDIRYNIIHYTDEYYTPNYSGIAASQVDPDTGEIFSTTSVISISTPMAGISLFIRNYLRYKLGMLKKKELETILPISQAMPELYIVSSDTSNDNARSSFNPVTPKAKPVSLSPFRVEASGDITTIDNHPLGFNLDLFQRAFHGSTSLSTKRPNYSKIGTEHRKKIQQNAALREDAPFKCSFGSLGGTLITQIERLCTTSYKKNVTPLAQYLTQLKTSNQTHKIDDTFSFDSEIVEDCATKLAFSDAIATGVHELGHAIGLDHNFMGSADRKNFYNLGDTGEADDYVQSSSIMDYSRYFDPRLMVPGRYDLATVRYIYDNQVQLKNGKLSKPLDISRSIPDQLGVGNIRPYMTCNDHDEDLRLDPFCRKFDQGTTPLEVVNHTIAQFQSFVATGLHRYDRRYFYTSDDTRGMVSERFLKPLKDYYDTWRHLVREKVGTGDQYLENYDSKTFKTEILDAMATDPLFKDRYALWRPAAVRIMNFFLNEIAFVPNHYCVGELSPDLPPILVEMSEIRDSINANREDRISNCSHPAVQTVMASRGLKTIDEVGHPLHDVRYASKGLDITREDIDEVGIANFRAASFYALILRSPYFSENYQKGFFPNMLDEPDFRELTWNKVSDRILNGVQLKDYKGQTFNNYLHEQQLTELFSLLYKRGLSVPQKPEVFLSRIVAHRGELVPIELKVRRANPILDIKVANNTATIGVYSASNTETLKFLREYIHLMLAKTMPAIEPAKLSQLAYLRQHIAGFYPAATVEGQPSFLAYMIFTKKLVDIAKETITDSDLYELFEYEFSPEFNFNKASALYSSHITNYDQYRTDYSETQTNLTIAQTALDAEKRKGAQGDPADLKMRQKSLDAAMKVSNELAATGAKLNTIQSQGSSITVTEEIGHNYVFDRPEMLSRLDNMIRLHNRAVKLQAEAPVEAQAKANQLFKEVAGSTLGMGMSY